MKIRLLLAGALFLELGAFSHAQGVDPGIVVPSPPSQRVATLQRQLAQLEQIRVSFLREFKPNSSEVRAVEEQIRYTRQMIKRESSPLSRADEKRVWNQVIAQLEHERRALLRQPKTEVNRAQLAALDAQLRVIRVRRNGSGARPTPTPQVQLLSR